MKWTPYLLVTLLVAAGCQSAQFPKPVLLPEPEWLMPPTQVIFAGGNGSSSTNAVVINGAISSKSGIYAEHAWLDQKEIESKQILQQSVLEINGSWFDVVEYIDLAEQTNQAWFDITSFYGKNIAGQWTFTATNGEILSGNIDDLDTPVWEGRPWESVIGGKSGSLTYQIMENTTGYLGYGPLASGKFSGTWRFFAYDGAQDQRGFKDGKYDRFWYAWYPNGNPWIQQRWDTNTQWSSFFGWNEDGKKYKQAFPF